MGHFGTSGEQWMPEMSSPERPARPLSDCRHSKGGLRDHRGRGQGEVGNGSRQHGAHFLHRVRHRPDAAGRHFRGALPAKLLAGDP
eukprot:scaffold11619_cov99-Isochrysis_galbana.AAC.4